MFNKNAIMFLFFQIYCKIMNQMINGFHGANGITNTLHHSYLFQLKRLHNFEQTLKIRKTI